MQSLCTFLSFFFGYHFFYFDLKIIFVREKFQYFQSANFDSCFHNKRKLSLEETVCTLKMSMNYKVNPIVCRYWFCLALFQNIHAHSDHAIHYVNDKYDEKVVRSICIGVLDNFQIRHRKLKCHYFYYFFLCVSLCHSLVLLLLSVEKLESTLNIEHLFLLLKVLALTFSRSPIFTLNCRIGYIESDSFQQEIQPKLLSPLVC